MSNRSTSVFIFSVLCFLSGCDLIGLRSCPGSFPQHFPLHQGATFTYAYTSTSGGGLGSGEERGYGTVIWKVEEFLQCDEGRLTAVISTSSTVITETRTFVGDDQTWRRRDSTHTLRKFPVHFSADEGVSGVLGSKPTPYETFQVEHDTLVVPDYEFKESNTRMLVRDVGLVQRESLGVGGTRRADCHRETGARAA